MLLAKSAKVKEIVRYQTLTGHTKDVIWLTNALIDKPSFDIFCSRWRLEKREAKTAIIAIAALHDIGKATQAFQSSLRKGKYLMYMPHALTALIVAYECWNRMNLPKLYKRCSFPIIELLTILGHHSLLYDGLYQNSVDKKEQLNFHPLTQDALSDIFSWIYEKLDLPEFKSTPSLPFNEWSNLKLEKCLTILENLKIINSRLIETINLPEIAYLKALYSFTLSRLKMADYLASQAFADQAANLTAEVLQELLPPLPNWDLNDEVESPILRKLVTLYPFQKELYEVDKNNVILIAPCGRGKTEGALLWFAKQKSLGNCDRLIIAMPTQITSNAMRERLASMFGENSVGLYHGRSFLEHRELVKLQLASDDKREDLDPDLELQLTRNENFWSEAFAKPITVTTLDHLLFTFVHGYRQADFALGCLQTAAIVFDEIHCYDRQMLSELRELFNLLRMLKIPHMVMSGTLPNFIIEETGITDYHTVVDNEGLSFKPFILRKREYPMFIKTENKAHIPNKNAIEEIIDGFNRGLCQFVIVNTVRKAQTIYRTISEKMGSNDNLYCLHSRFCYIHRRKKEQKLIEELKQGVKPLILVATQVIEVSLDISCDRMFTELAPPDALGQRGGRLNRGAKEPNNHELIIFPIEDPHPYLIPRERKPLPELEKTWQNLQDNIISSYDWLKKLCDTVYESKRLSTAYLRELFKKCTLFGLSYEEIRFSEEKGKAYRPRDIIMPTIDVIPQSVICKLDNEAFDPLYLAPVPIWWLKKPIAEKSNLFYTHKVEDQDWLVCSIPYDEDSGFDEEKIGTPPHGVVMD